MRHHRTLALLVGFLVSGCYQAPSTAEFLVDTIPPGATCVISQLGQPIATVEPTPAIAIVNLVGAEIGVLCRRPGYLDVAVAVPPPPPPGLPGYTANRRPQIDYQTRVDVAMRPVPPGMAR